MFRSQAWDVSVYKHKHTHTRMEWKDIKTAAMGTWIHSLCSNNTELKYGFILF